jgi:hypothetical protein
MNKTVWIGVGALLIVAGVIFTLQGLNLVGGSAMSGVTLWAILGPIVAILGLVAVVVGVRRGGARP